MSDKESVEAPKPSSNGVWKFFLVLVAIVWLLNLYIFKKDRSVIVQNLETNCANELFKSSGAEAIVVLNDLDLAGSCEQLRKFLSKQAQRAAEEELSSSGIKLVNPIRSRPVGEMSIKEFTILVNKLLDGFSPGYIDDPLEQEE